MFTGIIETVGIVQNITEKESNKIFFIKSDGIISIMKQTTSVAASTATTCHQTTSAWATSIKYASSSNFINPVFSCRKHIASPSNVPAIIPVIAIMVVL